METAPLSESPVPDDARERRLRRWAYALIITAAAGVLLARIVTVEPLQSANDTSRWTTVWSLVERRTYVIDEILERPGWQTIDKVRHDGHFYSSKPALLPTLVAGVYWTIQAATGWDLLHDTSLVARLILVVVNLIPWIIALALIAAMAERYARTNTARLFVVAAAAFATFLTTFQVTLNNHTIAAVSVIFALYPALRILTDGRRCPLLFAAAGFFAAFASTNELPAALFGVALFGVLFYQSPEATLLYFVPAALLPLAGHFITTYFQTGGWKPFYLYYGTEKYEYVHEGVPSYWLEPAGLDRATDPWWQYLLHCTVGHHGILSLTPIFVLTLIAWLRLRRWTPPGLRWVQWMGLGLTAAILAFYLSRTENYNYGGNTAGLRWTFWLIPFWLLAMVPVLDQWSPRRGLRLFASFLLLVSVFSAFYPLRNPWQHPWLFVWMENVGWIDYSAAPPPKFDPPLTTWFRSLPEPHPSGLPQWIEFAGPEYDGTLVRMLLMDGGREETADGTLQTLIVRWSLGAGREREDRYYIDVAAFRAGAPPREFLRWPADKFPEGPPSEQEKAAARTFLRGMPGPRPFNEGVVRYRKVPLRPDEAFRCQAAASRVRASYAGVPRSFWFRCDTWICDDVPFGTIEVSFTVTDDATGEAVSRRVFRAVRASSIR